MSYSDPKQNRAYQREWVAARRESYMHDKSCLNCGSKDHLEIHHKDPSKKIGHRIWGWKAERRLAELEKCIVLCRGCHRQVHWEQVHYKPGAGIQFQPEKRLHPWNAKVSYKGKQIYAGCYATKAEAISIVSALRHQLQEKERQNDGSTE